MSDPYLGQIGLIPHPATFIPKAICWFTGSDVYHVLVGIGNGQVIGAAPGGAVISKVTDWPSAIWSRFDLTDTQAQGTADWARKHEGAPYSFLACAVIGFECRTGIRFPHAVNRYFDNAPSFECASMADSALTLGGGVSVFDDGRDRGLVYPGSFEQLFRTKGWWPADAGTPHHPLPSL